jgi:hypothetical protein
LKKIIWGICLFFAFNIIFGCAGLVPIVPVMGTIYDGYVGWKEHQSIKYYAADINTIHRAVMLSSQQLNLKVVRKKPPVKKGHALEVKCKEPLQIEILPFERKVTKVIIKIELLGDKQFAHFFYQRIDANVAKIRRG